MACEGEALVQFNPSDQAFLAEKLDAVPEISDGLCVMMFLKDESGTRRPLYRFAYYFGANGGVIRVPVNGEPGSAVNRGALMTMQEGGWFAAAPEWDAFVESLLLGWPAPGSPDST
jgi:hypothetical protein